MKKKLKSVVAVLVIFLLCFSSTVFAAENENYSLTYTGIGKTGHSITVAPKQYTTAATQLLSDGTVENLTAYCVDSDIQLTANHSYTTKNLEDSGYFTPQNAKKLRGILLNSFPFITLEEIRTRSAKQVYTEEEAITAAQLAIWKVSNAKDYTPYVWPDYGESGRITALQGWYMTLAEENSASPVAGIEIKSTVQGTALDIAYRATETNSDGSAIDLTCNFTPSVVTEPGAVDGEGFSHILVTNPAPSNQITISGSQTVARDAYLYSPKGGRTAAQSLGGVQEKAVSLAVSATIPFGEEPVVTPTPAPPSHTGGIRIHKIDSASEKPIPDVFFEFSQSPDFPTPVYVAITDNQGIALQDGLEAGDWYVRERKAPDGYMPYADVITVSVGEGITEFDIKNTPYSGIKILKTDGAGKPLAAALFSIYEGEEATGTPLFQDLASDKDGVILKDSLAAGTYTIVETSAPEGYEKDPTPVTVQLKLGETRTLTFANTLIPTDGTMHLLKFDAVSKKQLAGAEFTIYRDEALTDPVKTVTSFADKPAVLENLKAGVYYVKETKVPEGYLIDPATKLVNIRVNETTVVNFFNTRGVPTAGNYGALQIAGISIISVCALGWLIFFLYHRKNRKK